MISASRLARAHAACFVEARAWSVAEFETLLAVPTTQLFGDEDCFALLSSVADEAEILTLATHPDHRRKGLARALLAEIDARLPPVAQRIFLEVDEKNEAARALYATCGFGAIGRRKNYYAHSSGDRSDALILGKNLT